MKVLHHTAKFLPLSQTFIKDLIQSLSDKSIDCSVITHEIVPNDFIERFHVKDISFNANSIWKKKAINAFNMIRGLAHNTDYNKSSKLIRYDPPDIIHCHFGTAAYFNYYLQKHAGSDIPVLISFHGFDVFNSKKLFRSYIKTVDKLIMRNCLCTCPSEFLKSKVVDCFNVSPDKVIVIPNGFNSDLFKTSFCQYSKRETLNILHIGRFVDLKGQRYLIDMMALLKRNGVDNIHLTLVGDGENKLALEAYSRTLGVDKEIVFAGAIQHREVAKLLANSHLYIHPSYTDKNGAAETFGVAILEALAVGKPVIITDSGGMSEILPPGNTPFAKVVKQKSSISLADAVIEYMEELPKMNHDAFCEFQRAVVDKNNLKRSSSMIIDCYNQLLRSSN